MDDPNVDRTDYESLLINRFRSASVHQKFDVVFRVPEKVARKWLLENKSIIIGGDVYYFEIRNLGLGVCSVRLRSGDSKDTLLF